MPDIEGYHITSHLDDITMTNDEVRFTLKALPIGKASINKRVLKELAGQLGFYSVYS